MCRKLKKLCAWALAVVTVLSVVPSSGMVLADQTTDENTANVEEVKQGTVYFKVPNADGQIVVSTDTENGEEADKQTITVSDEKTTLTDKDGNVSDVALTKEGYCLELTEDVGTTIHTEVIASEGYEVGTYHILSDTGDEVENKTLSSDNKYDVTVSKDAQVVEVIFNAIPEETPIDGETSEVDEVVTPEETPEEEVVEEETEVTEETTEEIVPEEEVVEEETTTDESSEDTEEKTRDYASEEIRSKFEEANKIIKENFDIGKSENANLGIAPLYVGETIYSKGFSAELGERGTISIIRYHEDGVNYDLIDDYDEGILGADTGEWMFCSNPTMHFSSGNKTSVDARNYYSEDTITLIAGLLYYVDQNACDGLTDVNRYYIKQGLVWTILNTVDNWYSGSNVAYEYGNGMYDNQGHAIAGHVNDFYSGGTAWVNENKDSLTCSGEIFEGNGQPISRWTCSYTPKPKTGDVTLKKVSGDSGLTSGNSNYSYAGAQYGVYNDSTLNNRVGILTTDELGNSNTLTLDAGTYYVREITPSKGYMPDNTIHTVAVQEGQTATVTSNEPPISVTVNLTKQSDNPNVTSNNDLYSLKGAEYSIYRDANCTQYVTKITTDENGNGTVTGLPLNTYYMKETKASQGFGKDTKVYTIDASTGTTEVVTKSITSTEPCLMDPTNLLLQKVDAETGTKTPVDEGTLRDAQFEVKLYDTVMTTDPGASGHRPIWSAVMRTDSDGYLELSNSYRVSGDLVMTDTSGRPSLPYGTITFKEIKSPSGYLINSTVIVKQITGNGGSLTTVPQYEAVTQKEQPMTLKIIKVQNGTTLRIPDAQFKWTLPDGSTHTYTTNSNGEVYFKGLEWGKHTIEEVKVPDGYSVNKNKITFTVNQDNTITGASGATVTDTDGNFTLVIDNNNLNPTVTYENKPAPFDLHVYKINDVDFALEGAEFTIYTDAACKNVWKKATTDSSGNLTFTDLIVGKTYYMKETKAPQGYRIPINDDGSDIVYKIKVTSTPVKNEFTFYVNDKAYTTASTGNYKVSGTKADRVCDMTIINERGKRLPETGSNMMLVLVIAGAALMGGALVVSRRKTTK